MSQPGRGKTRHQKNRPRHRGRSESTRIRAGWQRLLMWAAWGFWLYLAWMNSKNVAMGWKEILAFLLAVTVTVLCFRFPAGKPRVLLEKPEELMGEFGYRLNWPGLVISSIFALGGLAAGVRAVQHIRSGRNTFRGVLEDCGVFILGWFRERIQPLHDAELEKTEAYILVIMLPPALLAIGIFLMPWLNGGVRFRITEDAGILWRNKNSWQPLDLSEYTKIEADGTGISFYRERDDASNPVLILPLHAVYSTEHGTPVDRGVIGAWFRQRISTSGFRINPGTGEDPEACHWKAERKAPA